MAPHSVQAMKQLSTGCESTSSPMRPLAMPWHIHLVLAFLVLFHDHTALSSRTRHSRLYLDLQNY